MWDICWGREENLARREEKERSEKEEEAKKKVGAANVA